MDELEISKFVGVGCAAMLAFVGFSEISSALVSVDNLDEPAYAIAVAEEDGAEEVEEAVPLPTLMASADPSAGARTFRACQACHNIAEGAAAKLGPNLWGVVGREIAAADGFGYSNALSGKDGAWDWEALNGFLLAPRDWAPGTNMAYNGIKNDEERANLMAYLNEQSGEPIPLPAE